MKVAHIKRPGKWGYAASVWFAPPYIDGYDANTYCILTEQESEGLEVGSEVDVLALREKWKREASARP